MEMCVVLGFFTYAEVTRGPPKMPSRSGLRTVVRRLSTPVLETSTLSYGENPKSLSHLVLKRYWDVTPGWTDGQNYRSLANTCYASSRA